MTPITRAQIGAIHALAKRAGLDDETYRDYLARAAGVRSSKELSRGQAIRVIDALKALSSGSRAALTGGSKPARPPGAMRLDGPYAAKLRALWIAAWNLGLVRDRTDRALVAFVRRQTGIEHTRWLRDPWQAARVIEALKGWMARAGGVDWSEREGEERWRATHGGRIAVAQWNLIGPDAMPAMRRYQFGAAVHAICGRRLEEMTRESDWIEAMNAFGRRVRAVRERREGEAREGGTCISTGR